MTPATACVGMGEKNEWRGASIFSSKIVPGCKQKTIKAIISAKEKDTLHVRSSHKKKHRLLSSVSTCKCPYFHVFHIKLK